MSRKSKAAEFADEGYKIHVTGRNVQVTEPMKNYAIEKVTKIEKFSNRILDITIIMDIQKLEHRVDIIVKVDHNIIKSHAASMDMYASIDMAVDKLDRQLLKYRGKVTEHHRAKALGVVDMRVHVIRPTEERDVADVNEDIDRENQRRLIEKYKPHEVVSEETMPLKILNRDEAIKEMEFINHSPFLIYRDEESHQVKVIYRRDDGNYGIIDIET